MDMRDIPEQEWPVLCNRLNHDHGQSPVTVKVNTPKHHRELVGRALSELKARQTPEGETIFISVGDRWDGYLGHTVAHPTRVRLVTPAEGEETLVIEAADGSTMVVDFYPAD